MRSRITLAILAAAVATVVSCTGRKPSEPDVSYAEYVQAYTGGKISSSEPVVIRLAQEVPSDRQVTDGLFSFTPSVKGEVRWSSPTSVEFIPEDPGFTKGNVYKGTFNLGKVSPLQKKFPFSFFVKEQDSSAQTQDMSTDDRGFRVKSAVRKDEGFPHIDIVFSENLAENASLRGIVELEGVQRYNLEVKQNLVSVHFEGPGEVLTLRVAGSIRSAAGNLLGNDYERTFVRDDFKPAVQLLLQGNILPDQGQLVLPFRAVCLSAVDISVIQIFEDNVLMFLQDNSFSGDDALRRSGRLILRKTLRLDEDPSKDLHEWNDFSVDLTNLFKQEKGAIYRIRITFNQDYSLYGKDDSALRTAVTPASVTEADKAEWDEAYSYWWESWYDWDEYDWDEQDNPENPTYYMDSDRYPVVNLLTSELAVIAKYADGDKIWVNVNKILDAKPASGVSVDVYDYQLRKMASGKTDGKGGVELTVDHRPFVVTATSSAGYITYLKVNEGTANSLSRFDVGGTRVSGGIKSYIYGERGVWRPGDTLHVTMLISDPEKTIPAEHPATVEVYTPEGQFFAKRTASSVDGFYTFHIPTRVTSPTGFYNAYFHLGGSTFHKSLHIETVKPNRLKVQFDPGTPVLQAGVKTNATMKASWLTGPPAAGLKSKAQLILSVGNHKFKGFEDYVFTNPGADFSCDPIDIFEAELAVDGTASRQITMPHAGDAPGMLTGQLVSKVMESGGDESFTVEIIPFSPFSSYVGLKFPEGDYLETDQDQTIRVAVVDAFGKRVGGHQLEYRVFKLRWSWWWESRSGELDSYVNGSDADAIASGTLRSSASSDATFSIRVNYPEWGRYLVFVRDTYSGHVGGKVITIDWPSYRGRAERRDPEALSMLSFSTDKKEYAVGETATVYIPAAKGGQALVSIENARKVIARHHVATAADKETPFTLKITEEMAPNFFIHITLAQPYGNVDTDLPLRLYGVQRVNVSNPGSRLEPVIKVADSIHPEEEFTVTVSEAAGKPMTYTLAIVDEGLLDITAFKTPNAWSTMYAPEALGVSTWDMYDDIIGAFSGRFSPMYSVGGDGANVVGARKDNRFNPVVLFYGPFTLEKGSKTHTIKLPMYVGSVRVMVVAGHDRSYGSAEKAVTVKSPLMVLTTLPRVLSASETVTLPVNVFAMEDGARTVNVSVKAEGPVKVEGSNSTSLSFTGTGDQVARFAITATDEGVADITVLAESGSLKYTDRLSVEIRNPNPETISVKSFELAAGKSMKVKPEGSTTLSLASFPSLNASSVFRYFKNYPYDCSEQLSAKGLALLHLFGFLDENEQAQAKDMLPQVIEALYARQNADGGFPYWKGGRSDTWVSSMAGEFLTEAAAKGYTVSWKVLDNWQNYQNKICQAYRAAGNSVFTDMDQAYRLYTLAVAGKAQTSAMNRLKEQADLGYRASWMLAAAYAVNGKTAVAREIITSLTDEFEENGSSNPTFGSWVRDKAIALDALALTELSARTMALAEDVANQVNKGWLGTEEGAFAAIAMDHLAAKLPNQTIKADIGGQAVQTDRPVYTIAIPEEVTVKNTSGGPVYATVVNVGRKPAGTVVPAAASGLAISAVYTDAKGAPVNVASLSQGTEFTATVTVRNTGVAAVNNLALQEMIPSGWEIVNDRLLTGKEVSYDNMDIRDDRVNWFFSLGSGSSRKFTVRLRAAYEGTYTLPAIKCESMYDSRIAANTASATVKVTK